VAFGAIFCGMPLLVAVLAMDCGTKLVVLLPIILGTPILMYICGQQHVARKRANPSGKLELVDEQAKQLAMTTAPSSMGASPVHHPSPKHDCHLHVRARMALKLGWERSVRVWLTCTRARTMQG
jgi:hypothetical protein